MEMQITGPLSWFGQTGTEKLHCYVLTGGNYMLLGAMHAFYRIQSMRQDIDEAISKRWVHDILCLTTPLIC